MGTARMGADRASSVVAPSGESHELDGLYIADASILPSSLGVNPMITIMACARRIAAGIADRLCGLRRHLRQEPSDRSGNSPLLGLAPPVNQSFLPTSNARFSSTRKVT